METQNWLLKQATTQPNQIAVDDGDQRLTFAQLKNRVATLIGKLDQLNPGKKVGLIAVNTMMSYQLAIAIICSGRTIVWLNWRLADEELERQVKDSQLTVCLVDDALLRPTMDKRFVSFTRFREAKSVQGQLTPSFNFDQVASIMYTSGTTGNPKGVLQTFGNHFYSAVSSALNLGLSSHDEWLCVAPIFHISGFSIMMRGLIYGMTVRLAQRFRVAAIEKILVDEPVTIMSVVPFMLQQLLKRQETTGRHYHKGFRCMLLGGGTTSQLILEKCEQQHIPVVQCYGMTETSSQIIALRARDALKKLGSVGQPLFTTQLKLADNGEIMLKTPALTPGYLNMPGKLESKMVDGWYRTGDVGHLDSDGYLYIDGRLDEMLISGGENIFPQEVEQVYQRLDSIKDIAIVGQRDQKWGEVPVAFIVCDGDIDKRQLEAYGRQHLAHYKVPHRFIRIDHLPKNASGKIKRYLLRQQLL